MSAPQSNGRQWIGVGKVLFDVEDADAGVGERLAEDGLGVRAELGGDRLLGERLVEEFHLDAHLLHRDGEEVRGAAVDRRGREDVVAGLREVENRVEVGGLAGGREHGADAAFQRADLVRHDVVGGVLQARVEVARGFEVEEFAHLFARGVAPRRGLVDGELAGLAVFGLPAALDAERVGFHGGKVARWNGCSGAPERVRTSDTRFRKPVLCPTELLGRKAGRHSRDGPRGRQVLGAGAAGPSGRGTTSDGATQASTRRASSRARREGLSSKTLSGGRPGRSTSSRCSAVSPR